MKSKLINSIISKKFNDFLESIKDPHVKALVKENSIITGGSIVSLLLNEEVNDYDIYFTNKETVKAVAEYYCNEFNVNNKDKKNRLGKNINAWVLDGEDVELWKSGKKKINETHPNWDLGKYVIDNDIDNNVPVMLWNTDIDRIKVIVDSDGILEENIHDVLDDADSIDYKKLDEKEEEKKEKREKYRPVFLSSNAITLSNKIQLIIRFYGDANQIHKNFDFVHATCYWQSSNQHLELPSRALEAIINKELFYVGSKYPVCSIFRIKKFLKRGWNINAGQMLKICLQISELDLKNIAVLEDQLVGVDSVYFYEVINQIRNNNDPNTSIKNIDSAYLFSVIDKIF